MDKKNLQRELIWRIPSAINLPKIIKNHPPNFKFRMDYGYYFIHLICDMMDYLDPNEPDKWVHLHSKKMRALIHNYKKYIDYLVSMGIILCNPSYKTGEHSKGYKIAPMYYKGDVMDIALIDDKNVAFKRKLRRTIFSRSKKVTNKEHHLTKWLNDKLKIDSYGANMEVFSLYRGKKEQGGKFKSLRAIKNISEGNFYFKIDNNIGRFHSNLTNMKKEIRNYLTYDGKKLVNLDIKNSQPLLSGILLDENFYTPGKTGGKFTLSRFNSVNSLINIKQLNKIIIELGSIIMCTKSPESLDSTEFDEYLSAVEKGKFYEEFFKLSYPGKTMDQISRNKIKITVYIIFFADNRHGWKERRLEAPFKKHFPTIYKIFSILKRHNKTVLSHILQRIESELIIEIITKRIAKERPELPIFTIHDSVATTVGNEDYVQRVMEEEILKATGLNAKIGIEYWETVIQKDLKTQKPIANAA